MSKAIAIAFGRMQPPTRGHQLLVQTLQRVAQQDHADAALYLSHTTDPRTDPLPYAEKLRFATLAFGSVVKASSSVTIIAVMQELALKGYTDVIYVAGQDRLSEFQALLTKYHDRKTYHFNSIKVVSAGQRDPDAPGVMGLSASKMRDAVKAGDRRAFMDGVPTTLSTADVLKLYYAVRRGMGLPLSEARDVAAHHLMSTDGLRKNDESGTPGQDSRKNADECFERAPTPFWHTLQGALSRPLRTR